MTSNASSPADASGPPPHGPLPASSAEELLEACDALCELDHRYRIVRVNAAQERLTGRLRQETLGRTCWEVWPDSARPDSAYWREFHRCMQQRLPVSFEMFHAALDRWTSVTAHPTSRGGLVALFRDITLRKRAEALVRESEERFRTAVEQAGDAIFLHDDAGRIRDVNRRACESLGYTREELLRMSIPDFDRDFDLERARVMWASVKLGEQQTFPSHHRRKDGTVFPVEVRDACLRFGGERLFLGIARDLSGRRRLADAERLESVGRLAGGVAHDFNNLLTVILGAGEAMRQQAGTPGATIDPEALADLLTAARRASDLTRQLLAFARRQPIAPTVLDLDAVVRASEPLVRRAIREDIDLRLDLARELPPVRCDRAQLEQVLLNLAANARDAMPRGGTLTLRTRDVPGFGAAGAAALVVEDSGEGLSPEARAHLFEPFFTTKPQGEGTGLGLATVYGIVHQNGGEVLVDSAPGRGTTFELRFPHHVGPGSRSPVAAPAEEGDVVDRGEETLVVVEDEPAVRKVTVRALAAGGYRVLEASGGTEALDLLGRTGAAPALLATDVVMPGVGGAELAKRVRALHPGVRVLFLSGYPRALVAHEGELPSDVEFLAKPFTQGELLRKVRVLLDGATARGA